MVSGISIDFSPITNTFNRLYNSIAERHRQNIQVINNLMARVRNILHQISESIRNWWNNSVLPALRVIRHVLLVIVELLGYLSLRVLQFIGNRLLDMFYAGRDAFLGMGYGFINGLKAGFNFTNLFANDAGLNRTQQTRFNIQYNKLYRTFRFLPSFAGATLGLIGSIFVGAGHGLIFGAVRGIYKDDEFAPNKPSDINDNPFLKGASWLTYIPGFMLTHGYRAYIEGAAAGFMPLKQVGPQDAKHNLISNYFNYSTYNKLEKGYGLLAFGFGLAAGSIIRVASEVLSGLAFGLYYGLRLGFNYQSEFTNKESETRNYFSDAKQKQHYIKAAMSLVSASLPFALSVTSRVLTEVSFGSVWGLIKGLGVGVDSGFHPDANVIRPSANFKNKNKSNFPVFAKVTESCMYFTHWLGHTFGLMVKGALDGVMQGYTPREKVDRDSLKGVFKSICYYPSFAISYPVGLGARGTVDFVKGFGQGVVDGANRGLGRDTSGAWTKYKSVEKQQYMALPGMLIGGALPLVSLGIIRQFANSIYGLGYGLLFGAVRGICKDDEFAKFDPNSIKSNKLFRAMSWLGYVPGFMSTHGYRAYIEGAAAGFMPLKQVGPQGAKYNLIGNYFNYSPYNKLEKSYGLLAFGFGLAAGSIIRVASEVLSGLAFGLYYGLRLGFNYQSEFTNKESETRRYFADAKQKQHYIKAVMSLVSASLPFALSVTSRVLTEVAFGSVWGPLKGFGLGFVTPLFERDQDTDQSSKTFPVFAKVSKNGALFTHWLGHAFGLMIKGYIVGLGQGIRPEPSLELNHPSGFLKSLVYYPAFILGVPVGLGVRGTIGSVKALAKGAIDGANLGLGRTTSGAWTEYKARQQYMALPYMIVGGALPFVALGTLRHMVNSVRGFAYGIKLGIIHGLVKEISKKDEYKYRPEKTRFFAPFLRFGYGLGFLSVHGYRAFIEGALSGFTPRKQMGPQYAKHSLIDNYLFYSPYNKKEKAYGLLAYSFGVATGAVTRVSYEVLSGLAFGLYYGLRLGFNYQSEFTNKESETRKYFADAKQKQHYIKAAMSLVSASLPFALSFTSRVLTEFALGSVWGLLKGIKLGYNDSFVGQNGKLATEDNGGSKSIFPVFDAMTKVGVFLTRWFGYSIGLSHIAVIDGVKKGYKPLTKRDLTNPQGLLKSLVYYPVFGLSWLAGVTARIISDSIFGLIRGVQDSTLKALNLNTTGSWTKFGNSQSHIAKLGMLASGVFVLPTVFALRCSAEIVMGSLWAASAAYFTGLINFSENKDPENIKASKHRWNTFVDAIRYPWSKGYRLLAVFKSFGVLPHLLGNATRVMVDHPRETAIFAGTIALVTGWVTICLPAVKYIQVIVDAWKFSPGLTGALLAGFSALVATPLTLVPFLLPVSKIIYDGWISTTPRALINAEVSQIKYNEITIDGKAIKACIDKLYKDSRGSGRHVAGREMWLFQPNDKEKLARSAIKALGDIKISDTLGEYAQLVGEIDANYDLYLSDNKLHVVLKPQPVCVSASNAELAA